MFIHRKKLIQEAFRQSEVFTPMGESITPIYKVRENVQKFEIMESELKEYLLAYNPREYGQYINQVIQKIYHPKEEDLRVDMNLKLSLR